MIQLNNPLNLRKILWNYFRLRIVNPSQQLLLNAQKLDELEIRLLKQNKTLIDDNKEKLKLLFSQLLTHQNFIKMKQNELSNYGNSLNLLSPLNTLSRGYTMTQDNRGSIITSVKRIKLNEVISTKFHDGKVTSKVVNKEDN